MISLLSGSRDVYVVGNEKIVNPILVTVKPNTEYFQVERTMNLATQPPKRPYGEMEFRNKLEMLRKAKGLSKVDLASSLNVHQARISKWEGGGQ